MPGRMMWGGGMESIETYISSTFMVFSNLVNEITLRFGSPKTPIYWDTYLSFLETLLMYPNPPTFVKNDEFSEILTYKRAKNSLFECKWGGGLSEIWKFCRKFRRLCPNLVPRACFAPHRKNFRHCTRAPKFHIYARILKGSAMV
jgi:hypothetical protein